MRWLLTLTASLAAVGAGPAIAQDAEHRFDGIAAVVNGEVITIGEVRRAALLARENKLGVGALCEGRPVPAVTLARGEIPNDMLQPGPADPLDDTELQRARECLIDSRLVFREVRRFPRVAATDDEIDELMLRLQEQFGSADALAEELRRVALNEAEVRDDLRRQLLVDAYIDTRFRATIDITDEQARESWEGEFAPDMQEEGVPVPQFDLVREDVVRILEQREVNRRIQSWILDLRERASIQRKFP